MIKAFTVILVALATVLTAPTPAQADKKTAYERVTSTNILRCAYTSVGLPIHKNPTSGAVVGPLADIAEEMAKILGLKVEWTAEVGHADFSEGLSTGRYDAYCGILAFAPTRARVAALTDPILYIPYYVFVRVGDTRFKTIADMNKPDVRAGSIDGENLQLMSRRHLPNAKEYSLPNETSNSQLYLDVVHGKADVVVHDPLTVSEFNQHNENKLERAFKEPLETFPIGFAVGVHEHELQGMLNTAILALQSLGKIDEILDKYNIDGETYYRIIPPTKHAVEDAVAHSATTK